MRSTMSILGLYQWDDTIFENLVVPDGVDASLAVDSILFDNAELEIMYSDPEWMKALIGMWSSRELPVWERIFRAINKTYDPIENYNRTETVTQTDTSSQTGADTVTASGTDDYTDTVSNTITHGKTDTHKVSGYNGTALVDSTKDQEGGTTGESGSVIHDGDSTSNSTLSHSLSGSGSRSVSSNVKGNIGVTTSQQMLNQEFDVSKRTDIYMYISESFKNRFCLMVY